MSTPTVYESLVHLHSGSEVEVRYYIAHDGIRLLEVKVGTGWIDPSVVLLPHVIADACAELAEMEREFA